jgi:hypothetical protein
MPVPNYVIPSIYESPPDDNSGQDGSLTGPITATNLAVLSLPNEATSKGTTAKTADSSSGHMSLPAAGVAENPRTQWNVIELGQH